MPDNDGDVVTIIQLVNLYGLAVDSQRWELFDRIIVAEVTVDYGATAQWTDCEQFKSDFAAFHRPFDSTQHTMSTHVVHVDGDRGPATRPSTRRSPACVSTWPPACCDARPTPGASASWRRCGDPDIHPVPAHATTVCDVTPGP